MDRYNPSFMQYNSFFSPVLFLYFAQVKNKKKQKHTIYWGSYKYKSTLLFSENRLISMQITRSKITVQIINKI